ncbi:hypothetical protein HGA89_01115, partial [bacterium]|nr:hypothetical protein [bacterium]
GPGRGVSLADFDGDGDPDILVTQYNAPSRLLRNDGGGIYSDVTAGSLAVSAPAVAAAWADFDNDGDLDAYQTLSGQANRLLRNDGGGAFTDVAAQSMVADTGTGRAAGWADYDADGKVDLYVVNENQNNLLYHAYGDPGIGQWIFLSATPGVGATGQDNCMSWADYDNDGDQDHYLTYRGVANRLMQNSGPTGFSNVAIGGPLADAGQGMGCAWGDYDNDGWLDLYFVNDGIDGLVRNDAGVFSLVTGGALGASAHGRGAAWGDVDNDGDLDLYLTRYGQGDLLLRNDGAAGFTGIPAVVSPTGGNGVGCAWGDMDGDGDLDLYLVNNGGPSALLVNGSSDNGNHWLEIDLVGVTANRAAIGTRVRAVTGDRRQIREVSGGSGYYSQNSLTVHFGLGSSAEVDTLQVRWPGGVVQTFRRVDADQRLVISQDMMTGVEPAGPPPPAMALRECRPNPFNPATTIGFSLDQARRTRLAVYDLTGRLVRVLLDEAKPAGRYEVRWDGKSDRGRQMASGVYVCRMSAGSYCATIRMTLVK